MKYVIIIVIIIAVALITALIRTKIWNSHKEVVTSGKMTEEDYKKEVEQFGIYTPKPDEAKKPTEDNK